MYPGKKNSIPILPYLLLMLFVAACSNLSDNANMTTIRGHFPAFKGKKLTLSELDISNFTTIDTARVDKEGNFRIRFTRQTPGFYIVKFDNKNYLTLVLDKEKNVEISSKGADIRKSYSVKGSPDSELYRNFDLFVEVNRDKVDSLTRTYDAYQRSASFISRKMDLDKAYQDIFSNQRKFSQRFIQNHCSSLASLLVINKRFGERKILNEKDDYTYFLMVDSCLSINYPENPFLVEFKKNLNSFEENRRIHEMAEKQLSPGNKIPDIGLENSAGKKVMLSSLKGRPVILYFWTSRDPKSRQANKKLKALIATDKNIKPSVYAIGFDSYKKTWQDAIRQDGIGDWTQVTDLQNMDSPAKTLFDVPDDLPYFFLLDKEQVIVYKGNDFNSLALELNKLEG